MTRHRLLLTAGLVGSLATLLAAQGTPVARFRFEQAVAVTTAGPQRLDLNAALVAGAQKSPVASSGDRSMAPGGLGDLRLFSGTGAEVPYLIVRPSADLPRFVIGRILQVKDTEKTSGFEVDLESPQVIDAAELVRVRAPIPEAIHGRQRRSRAVDDPGRRGTASLPDEQLSAP